MVSTGHQPKARIAAKPTTAPRNEACSLLPPELIGVAKGLESVGSTGPAVVVVVAELDAV